jgi:hypothetical protein
VTVDKGVTRGHAARNVIPARRPYLSPAQRAMLAVLANRDHMALGDRVPLLAHRRPGDIRRTTGSRSASGMPGIRGENGTTWPLISDRGRQVPGGSQAEVSR